MASSRVRAGATAEKGTCVGDVVAVVGWEADDAGESYLFFGELGFERDDALLLGELFDFAAVDVDLGDEAYAALQLGLLEERGGGVELGVGRGDALGCGDDLEVGAADGEDDGVLGIACGELGGAIEVFGGAEVVPGGEVQDGLRDVAAEVDVVERADDGGEGESWDGDVDAYAFGGEVGLRKVLCEIAADVGEESAAGDLGLALRLTDGVVEVGGAEVVTESSGDGVAERELAGERAVRSAGGASGVLALNLNGGVDGGDAVGGAGDRGFDGGDGRVAAGASGQRQ